jgi:hypothetical protein
VWLPVCAAAGLPLLIGRPWLGVVLAGYLLLFGVNLAQARRRRERSLTNDLVLIAECVLFVPVVAGVATDRTGLVPPGAAMTTASVLVAALVCALTLIGSTLHVRSLIRERNNPAFTRVSRTFAVACPAVVLGACGAANRAWWVTIPFVLLAGRACWLHKPSWRPGRLGMVELLGFVVVAVTTALAI